MQGNFPLRSCPWVGGPGRERGHCLQEMADFEPPQHVASMSEDELSGHWEIYSRQGGRSSGMDPAGVYLSLSGCGCSNGMLSVPGDSCSVFIHLAFSISSGEKKIIKVQPNAWKLIELSGPILVNLTYCSVGGSSWRGELHVIAGCISVCLFSSCFSVSYESGGRHRLRSEMNSRSERLQSQQNISLECW